MIARRFSWMALAAMVVAGSVTMRADSLSAIRGSVATIELCAQSTCGAAIFVGIFAGQIGSTHALGTVGVAVTHEDLPDPGHSAGITGGVWQIQTFTKTIRGGVAGGTLFNNGDNTFTVHVSMVTSTGQALSFVGLLNHNPFPPTLGGLITP